MWRRAGRRETASCRDSVGECSDVHTSQCSDGDGGRRCRGRCRRIDGRTGRGSRHRAGDPAGDRALGLKGYDPVAYFTLATPTPGVAEYEYVYDGVRYRFANARHRDLFKANPDKYAPQFGGSCAMNMSNGVRREADPNVWVISNGNLYVFAGAGGAERFRQNPEMAAANAAAQLEERSRTRRASRRWGRATPVAASYSMRTRSRHFSAEVTPRAVARPQQT